MILSVKTRKYQKEWLSSCCFFRTQLMLWWNVHQESPYDESGVTVPDCQTKLKLTKAVIEKVCSLRFSSMYLFKTLISEN